ncbi:hypothetical protein K7G98_43975, partial [Saccharothrix sp. MB29]|nr:hypothetical protein [Saccharothrix sp. MB29]
GTALATRREDGPPITDVLRVLHEGADPALDRGEEVRAAVGEAVARTVRRVARTVQSRTSGHRARMRSSVNAV